MNKSNKILLILFAIFTIISVLSLLSSYWEPAFNLVYIVSTAILCLEWCSAHAEEHGIQPPAGSKILTVLFPPVGVVYYFFSGYGFKSGSLKILKAIFYFTALVLVNGVLYYAFY
jgi:hypothetical protein